MANLRFGSAIVFFFVFACLSTSHAGRPENLKRALFVFGDANFDVGNNNYINTSVGFRANFPPYGANFFKYPTGRPCDGRLIPDFIAEYAKIPFAPPYLQPGLDEISYGVNFASGAAGALDETLPGQVINLNTQLRYFKDIQSRLIRKKGKREAHRVVAGAVYLFAIGNNDYVTPYLTNSTFFRSFSHEQYVSMVVGNITAVIKDIYARGGRKFAFMSVGSLGCLPVCLGRNNGSCIEELNSLAGLHNAFLLQNFNRLGKYLKGFKHSYFNYYTAGSERLANPANFGLEQGKTACCGSGPYRGTNTCGGNRGFYGLCDNPRKYLFYDGGHPSEMANQQYAELMWNGSPDHLTGPYTIKSLFSS